MTVVPAALVDPTYLAELDAMLGRDVADTLVAPMLDELARAPSVIDGFLSAGDVVAARSAAHGLRGAALGVGCIGVADICAQMETDAAEALPGLAAGLVPIAARTAEILRAERR